MTPIEHLWLGGRQGRGGAEEEEQRIEDERTMVNVERDLDAKERK